MTLAANWLALHVSLAARATAVGLGAGLALWSAWGRCMLPGNDEVEAALCLPEIAAAMQETWELARGDSEPRGLYRIYYDQAHALEVGSGLPAGLLEGIMDVESQGVPWARSCVGAVGLMQLMPATARRFGVTDRLNPQQSLRGGLKYLQWLWAHYAGQRLQLERTIAAYNAGEGAVDRYGPYPPGRGYAETRAYVPKVLAAMRRAVWRHRRVGLSSEWPACGPLTVDNEREVFLGDPVCRPIPPTTIR